MSTGDPPDLAQRAQVTLLFNDWGKGNKEAGELVMPIIYGELHRLAESHLRGSAMPLRCRLPSSSMRPICAWWRRTYPIGKTARISSESPPA